MNAILLVGGQGTRLRPLTNNRPKALIPLLNRPFIAYLLDLLKEADVREVVFAAGHLAEPIRKLFPKFANKKFRLKFATEPEALGTGGAIRFAFEHLTNRDNDAPVLVFNGDVLFDLALRDFVTFHKEKNSACSIALKKVEDPTAFGVVELDSNQRILKFIEKPHSYVNAALINAGVYAIRPDLITRIPLGKASSVERDFFPSLLASGQPMHGFVSTGYWNDIGTHKNYLQAHIDLLTLKNNWTEKYFFRKRALDRGFQPTVFLGKNARISKKATLNGMVCCGDNVTISAGAKVTDSILMDRVKIGKDASLNRSIVGSGSIIDDGMAVTSGTVLSDKTHIMRQINE